MSVTIAVGASGAVPIDGNAAIGSSSTTWVIEKPDHSFITPTSPAGFSVSGRTVTVPAGWPTGTGYKLHTYTGPGPFITNYYDYGAFDIVAAAPTGYAHSFAVIC